MVESKSVPEIHPKLSAADRLVLIQTLNALPSSQFDELVFALEPPKGNIPGDSASQSNRSKALLEWADSPIGPGLDELETVLGMIIASQTKTAQEFLSFAISGKISSTTVTEVRAIVELLRKKTGDESIDVAFFKEGSINLILSGSAAGLRKLQELFESGELENLEISPVEAVHYVDGSSPDARKARLVKILRLASNYSIAEPISFAGNFTSALTNVLKLANILEQEQDTNSLRSHALSLYYILARTLAKDPDPDQNLAKDFYRARAIASSLYRDFDYDLENNFDYDLYFYRTNELASALANILASALAKTFADQLDFSKANLSNTNLRSIDLRQVNLTETDFTGADLARANLIRANLTGANFTGADVTKTVFGENLGLTETDKYDLQKRGAILLDPPSSDIFSLITV